MFKSKIFSKIESVLESEGLGNAGFVRLSEEMVAMY